LKLRLASCLLFRKPVRRPALISGLVTEDCAVDLVIRPYLASENQNEQQPDKPGAKSQSNDDSSSDSDFYSDFDIDDRYDHEEIMERYDARLLATGMDEELVSEKINKCMTFEEDSDSDSIFDFDYDDVGDLDLTMDEVETVIPSNNPTAARDMANKAYMAAVHADMIAQNKAHIAAQAKSINSIAFDAAESERR
jgi:hypothetical protein